MIGFSEFGQLGVQPVVRLDFLFDIAFLESKKKLRDLGLTLATERAGVRLLLTPCLVIQYHLMRVDCGISVNLVEFCALV